MGMIKKRVAELEGAQLDWAVAKADGIPVSERFLPSRTYSDWLYGGPIIERERLHVIPAHGPKDLLCWASFSDDDGADRVQYGDTPLIAAMRAFVASKLGDEVEVPA